MRKRKVAVLLVLSWFVPACHVAVTTVLFAHSNLCSFTLKGIFCNNSVNYLFCVASRAIVIYGLVVLFNISLLPMFFILFTYTMILIVACRSGGDVKKKAAQTCLPHLLVLINYSSCIFQMFLFYSLSGSEFLLLAAMAYDRYVSICKPLQYPTIMRKRKVTVLLVLSWLVPACHLVVPAVGYSHLLPMVFILFTYTVIIIVACRSGGDVRKKAAQTCLPHLLVLLNYSCLLTYDVIIVRLKSEISKTVSFVMTLQIIMYSPLFNPVVYGLKMKEIYKHLKRLLCHARG
uniref:G-protein coupled receptors family 1 profile domain-containing protein n=1 Tax=Xiphophorus couchianus TaxID=32473 RepID=A0A3B5MKT4_9TELE